MAIEDGSALEPWRGGKDERKHRAALNQARRQIESPQRAPTRIKRFIPCTCDWEPTELVTYQRRTGDYAILRVTDLWRDKGRTYPNCEVLDWQGREIPDGATLQGLGVGPVDREFFAALFKNARKPVPLTADHSRHRMRRRMVPAAEHEVAKHRSRRVASAISYSFWAGTPVQLAFAWPQQARFLEKQRYFQNVRDAIGLGDDVVRRRFLGIAAALLLQRAGSPAQTPPRRNTTETDWRAAAPFSAGGSSPPG
jgi:hypothetical protein